MSKRRSNTLDEHNELQKMIAEDAFNGEDTIKTHINGVDVDFKFTPSLNNKTRIAELEAEKKELVEALRKATFWGECVSLRVSDEGRESINFRDLEYARKILRKFKG